MTLAAAANTRPAAPQLRQSFPDSKLSASIMAKVNSRSSGCRAFVMAGKYLSSPSTPALTRGSGQRQRGMLGPQRRGMSSEAAGAGGKSAAFSQQEPPGYFNTPDRHVLSNRNLIYRDVKAFLSEVGGDPREARYWLTQFQRATASQAPAFAVLEVRRCPSRKFSLKLALVLILLVYIFPSASFFKQIGLKCDSILMPVLEM